MTTPAQSPVTPERLMQLAWGYAPPLIIEAALHYRVFDLLDNQPQTVEQIAAASGASVRGLRAILNALVGLQFLAKESGQQYSLTPESAAFLVSTKPSYQGGMIRHTSGHLLPKWLELQKVVASGHPAQAVNQPGVSEVFFKEFVADLLPLSYPAAQVLAEELKVANAASAVSVLDIAAGSGVWSIALAQRSPHVRVRVVDWEGVLPVTENVTSRFGVRDRYELVPGDILESDLGVNHQVALLGHILHSEGAERSKRLLKRTFDALAPGGTIAIAEFLVNEERTGPPGSLLFAVNMLINTDTGDTFSFAEIAGWLAEAGFIEARTLSAPGPSPLILATKPR